MVRLEQPSNSLDEVLGNSAQVVVPDIEAQNWIEGLRARPSRSAAENDMLAYLEEGWRELAASAGVALRDNAEPS